MRGAVPSTGGELARLNRALRMLSDANQALIRASDVPTLLNEICRISVEVGGYAFAWIGMVPAGGPEDEVVPTAEAGSGAAYLDPSTPAPSPIGGGTIAEALATRTPVVSPAIADDPRFGPRRQAAQDRGFSSSIVFPLLDGDRRLGIYKVYRGTPGPVEEQELQILTELAGDIAYGLRALETRTERDRAHNELRAAARLHRTLLDNLPDLVFRIELDATVSYASPSVERALPVPAAELRGRSISELEVWANAGEREQLMTSLREVLAGAPATRQVAWISTREGPRRFEVRHLAERDDLGQITSALCIATDLTERDRAERQLYLLNYALDNLREEIFLMQGDSPKFIYVNRSAATVLGYSVAELTGGMSVMDIDVGMDREAWSGLLPRVHQNCGLTIETTHRTKEGQLVPMEISGTIFEHGGERYNLAISRDVSERKAAEQALRTSELAYRSLVANSPDLVVRWNHKLERILTHLGLLGPGSPDEVNRWWPAFEGVVRRVLATGDNELAEYQVVVGDQVHTLQLRFVPERDEHGAIQSVLGLGRDISALKDNERQLRGLTENLPDIVLRLGTSGTPLYTNAALVRILGGDVGAEAALFSALHAHFDRLGRGPLDVEFQLPLLDGPHHFEARPILEPNDPVGPPTVLAVVRDTTAQHNLAEQLRQAQKMEAVGRLAGGIAHDFNNMLAVVQAQVGLLEVDPRLPPSLQEDILEIHAAAERAAGLTKQLLTFSRRQVRRPVDLDVSETVSATTRLLRRVLGEDVVLETRFAAGLPAIHADPGMIEQVLMNFAVNARDAMPAGGRLTISLESVDEPPARALPPPGAQPGPHVCLSVADTGTGISPEVLPRIFEPFFTTKAAGRGTGLGLATVLAIVEQHHGWIDIHSVVGQGTVFRVYFPAVQPAPAPPSPSAPPDLPRGHETILLVEDDPAVRMTTRKVLQRLGYRVLDADSGAAALQLWTQHHQEIQLLLTDVVMPGMSGYELSGALRAINPKLRVLYSSGYDPQVSAEGEAIDAQTPRLEKPFAMAELATAIRAALGGVGPS
jgi:two-component system cell cycle sensor histidine kinase/response regulator CckA